MDIKQIRIVNQHYWKALHHARWFLFLAELSWKKMLVPLFLIWPYG